MVSLQSSALLPEATKRPPWLSLVGSVVASSTGTGTAAATSKKRKRDGGDDDRGEVVDGIELNFDAAPLPPEWQRCLDIKVPCRSIPSSRAVCSVLSSDSCLGVHAVREDPLLQHEDAEADDEGPQG
jgi:hypothetical protein